jgi:DNA-binding transcriptional ArsR family regulator
MPSAKRKPSKKDDLLDPRLVKAISHPIRHHVLVMLNDRVASPNEIATEMGESLGRVSYHVRRLAEIGAIELVRTEPRRGAVEHFYRATAQAWFSAADWARLPKTTRRNVYGQNLDRIAGDVVAAAGAGGFDEAQAHVSVTLLDLDEQAIADVSALLARTLERVLEIQSESAARASGGDTASTELAIMHFGRAPAA